MKKLLFLLASSAVFYTACTNEKKYDIKTGEKYEDSKASLEDIERKNPERFLVVTGNTKKNLLKQTVIKGTVKNNAKVVSFKDVGITLRFYSKTGALMEEDSDTIYETIHPGGTANFKTKYFAPKGADSVSIVVTGAKY